MKLTEWEIKNFRSIRYGSFDFSDFTVIVGRNNSGKSNVIRSIRDYFEVVNSSGDKRPRHLFEQVRGGEKGRSIVIIAEYSLNSEDRETIVENISDQQSIDNRTEDILTDESLSRLCHGMVIDRSSVTASYLSTDIQGNETTLSFQVRRDRTVLDFRNFPQINYRKNKNTSHNARSVLQFGVHNLIRDLHNHWSEVGAFREPRDTREVAVDEELDKTGSKLPTALHTFSQNKKEKFVKIVDMYTDIMEGVTDIRTPIVTRGSQTHTTIEIDEEGLDIGIKLQDISAGSKEILVLITKIIDAMDSAKILIIEEPELHLHPDAEKRVFDELCEVAETGLPQVIVTTHSETFVNNSEAQNIVRVYRDESGGSRIQSITDTQVDETLIELGYNKSDLFQASAVVFVEGRSDQRILNEFASKLANSCDDIQSFDTLGVEVHALGGDRMKRHGPELARMVGRLRIPYLFVADSDDSDPTEKEQSLVKELGTNNVYILNQYSIESYLLDSEAVSSAFQYNIEKVSEFIEDNMQRPNKKSVLQDMREEFEERPISYDEEKDGAMIARHMDANAIDPEIRQLIKNIQDRI